MIFFHWKPVTESGLGFQVKHCSVQNSKQFFSRNLEDSHLQGSYFLILSAIANSLFYSLGIRVWSCFCGRTGDDIITCLAFGLGGRSSVQQQTNIDKQTSCVLLFFLMFLCTRPRPFAFVPGQFFFNFGFELQGASLYKDSRHQAANSFVSERKAQTDSKSTQPTYEIQRVYTFFCWYCASCVYGHCPKRCREKRIPCPESAQIQKHVASFWSFFRQPTGWQLKQGNLRAMADHDYNNDSADSAEESSDSGGPSFTKERCPVLPKIDIFRIPWAHGNGNLKSRNVQVASSGSSPGF